METSPFNNKYEEGVKEKHKKNKIEWESNSFHAQPSSAALPYLDQNHPRLIPRPILLSLETNFCMWRHILIYCSQKLDHFVKQNGFMFNCERSSLSWSNSFELFFKARNKVHALGSKSAFLGWHLVPCFISSGRYLPTTFSRSYFLNVMSN